jgi:hypothetical protein
VLKSAFTHVDCRRLPGLQKQVAESRSVRPRRRHEQLRRREQGGGHGTVGFWQNIWKGGYGRVAAGAQWEYIQRKSFDTIVGNCGSVSTNDNVFLTSLRYYPF